MPQPSDSSHRPGTASDAHPDGSSAASLPRIHVFNSMPFNGRGHSQTCYNICRYWPDMGVETAIHTTLLARDDPENITKPVIPKALTPRLQTQLYEAIGHPRLRHRSEANGLKRVRPGDICYFWPTCSIDALKQARAQKAVVVIEFINTHVRLAERIMDAERSHYHLPGHPDKDLLFSEEEARLQLADYAFAPGPFVGRSIREFSNANIDILETSYGAHVPDVLPPRDTARTGRPKFVFVGTFGLRKGARTLLQAWDIADLDAELHIFGSIEDMFEQEVKRRAARNIVFRGYASDIAEAYREADAFVFPSLEEGGPQVTYEAAGHGVPLIVTPMGGGRIADAHNAFIVEPDDAPALAAALTRMAQDPALRARMGAAARKAAPRYDWKAVARQRLTALTEALTAPKPSQKTG